MIFSIKQMTIKAAMLFFFTSFLFSCKKGEMGPEGPAGPAGPTGATGPTGAPNVKYSEWFTANGYINTTVYGIKYLTYERAAPEITQQVLDSGIVLTFGKLLGYVPSIWPTNQVSQLPISLTYMQGSTMTDTWSAFPSPQKLTIRFVNDKNYYNSLSLSHKFRYIIIPGGNKISSRQAADSYQQMSYSEICKRFQIPE